MMGLIKALFINYQLLFFKYKKTLIKLLIVSLIQKLYKIN